MLTCNFPCAQGTWRSDHEFHTAHLYVIEPVIESLLQVGPQPANSKCAQTNMWKNYIYGFLGTNFISNIVPQFLIQSVLVYIVLGPGDSEEKGGSTNTGRNTQDH